MKHVAKNGMSLLFLETMEKREKSINIGYMYFHHIFSTFLNKIQYSMLMVNVSLISKYQSFFYLCTTFWKYNFKFISDNPLYCKLFSYVF